MDKSLPERRGGHRALWTLARVALVVGPTLGLAVLVWVWQRPPEAVPIKLQGIWRTQARSHEDRFINVAARSISFGTGGNDALVFGVLGVASAREDRSETRYVLDVVDADGERDEVVLYHRQEAPLPALRLEHQDFLWRPHLLRPGDAP